MKNKNILIALLLGGMYLMLSRKGGNQTDKKSAILAYMSQGGDSPETKARFQTVVQQMAESEVNAVYAFIFDFLQKGKSLVVGSPLYNQIQTISIKYNIFT